MKNSIILKSDVGPNQLKVYIDNQGDLSLRIVDKDGSQKDVIFCAAGGGSHHSGLCERLKTIFSDYGT